MFVRILRLAAYVCGAEKSYCTETQQIKLEMYDMHVYELSISITVRVCVCVHL